jgi:HAD superfamily hydrolase (TIGR01509 family)
MRPKILFDLSEVLIGGFYGIEQVIARSEGLPVEKVRPIVAGDALRALCSGEISEAQYIDRIQSQGGWHGMTRQQLAQAIRGLFKVTIPTMPEYVAELSRECDLYLLSDHAREWIPDVVSYHPFFTHFKRRFYSFEVGSIKREGKPFRHVLDALGIQASDIFFVDDSKANVAKARENGIEATVFTSRAALEPVLRDWIRRQQARSLGNSY